MSDGLEAVAHGGRSSVLVPRSIAAILAAVLNAPRPLPSEWVAAYHAAIARLQALPLDLWWYPTVASTMDVATEAIERGAPEGLVICADEQTAGRGRRGRTWSSPAGGGLYLSFVFRPPHPPAADANILPLITLAGGLAVHDAIQRATGLPTELKWPNDVMVGGRKLAGILAEGFAIGTPDQAIVLGVGINVLRSFYPSDLADRATSVESELGYAVDRMALLEEVLVAVPSRYGQLRGGGASGVLRAWRTAAPRAQGAEVEWADGRRRGVTAGVDDRGALLVAIGDRIERIIAGEVRWL